MGVPLGCGKDAGDEVCSRPPVDLGDQQPFAFSRRALPGQEQHVDLVITVGVIRENGAAARSAAGCGPGSPGPVPGVAGVSSTVSHLQGC